MNQTCFTIGHSNHPVLKFIKLLKAHNISLVIDVRSQPFSKYIQEYNKENISKYLTDDDIEYAHLGSELGGRATDRRLMTEDGQTDYLKIMQTPNFKNGIKKVLQAIEAGEYVALMCTEKNPLDCHRFVLVSRALALEGVQVKHILDSGELIETEELEKQLLEHYKLDNKQATLFGPRKTKKELIDEAYELRGKEISYKPERGKT